MESKKDQRIDQINADIDDLQSKLLLATELTDKRFYQNLLNIKQNELKLCSQQKKK